MPEGTLDLLTDRSYSVFYLSPIYCISKSSTEKKNTNNEDLYVIEFSLCWAEFYRQTPFPLEIIKLVV